MGSTKELNRPNQLTRALRRSLSALPFSALVFAFASAFAGLAIGGQVSISTDKDSRFQIYKITEGRTQVQLVPAAGGNVVSIQVGGVEFLRQPESIKQLPGVGYGVPLLYPFPNRVKNATFTFDGKQAKFKANQSGNAIHGLVHSRPWDVVGTSVGGRGTSIRMAMKFTPGSTLVKAFPFEHQFYVTVNVRDGHVRWTYEVDNSSSSATSPIPYGFGLHPYFVYQGQRDATSILIPATHWMESERQMPSGNLIPADHLDYDLSKPLNLKDRFLDDVFSGLVPERATVIDFSDVQRKVTLSASKQFSHVVVWTPEDRGYFSVENQTCSTDAHNLHEQGNKNAAGLDVCPVGEKQSGWVEYRFDL